MLRRRDAWEGVTILSPRAFGRSPPIAPAVAATSACAATPPLRHNRDVLTTTFADGTTVCHERDWSYRGSCRGFGAE